MKPLVRVIAVTSFIVIFSLSSSADEIGPAIKDVPIFDAHMHYREAAWQPYPVKTVIELMDRAGVAMALVSSIPDEGTIKLWQYAPRRIVPELTPYHGSANVPNWTKSAGMLDYLHERLKIYRHEGIGEFEINQHQMGPSDRPFLAEIAKMASKRNIPLHMHCDADPVRLFYELDPGLTIIWAHAGMLEPPEVVGPMLEKYPTLYVETSLREGDILHRDGIDPDWLALIKRYPDRLMVGIDTGNNNRWGRYKELVAENRAWLSNLPRNLAERIAYRNAAKLFKRNISRGLLGKR